MTQKVIKIAAELADAIAESEELSSIRDLEIRIANNADASDLMDEFREKQQKLYMMQMNGDQLSDADKLEVEAIEAKMQQNLLVKAYIDSTVAFDEMMKGINHLISQAIQGDSEGGCGCGSGCGSDSDAESGCGGCKSGCDC